MRKLFENIEDIDIRGDISELTEVVTVIDCSLQGITESSDQVESSLIRYSAANKGKQYEHLVNTTMVLCDVLHEASLVLNDLQNQVVAYQNKIYRYEEIPETAQRPNPFLVNPKRHVDAETNMIQFDKKDMMNLAEILKTYCELVYNQMRIIIQKKNDAAQVWRDSQYTIFAEYIDGVGNQVIEALKLFRDYYVYLQEKIKELD